MTVTSMTGFAETAGTSANWSWGWELRSVNGKGLDVRFRTGGGMDGAEQVWRKEVQKLLNRGNVTATLTVSRARADVQYAINEDLLAQLVAAAQKVAPDADVQPGQLMTVRGVIETAELEDDPESLQERDDAIAEGFSTAVLALQKARDAEGEHLSGIMARLIDEIEELLGQAIKTAELQGTAIAEKLRSGVEELLAADVPLPEERLAQEVAVMIAKADVREEVDRLRAHVAQARELLQTSGPVGRKFDFLAQEFNREANTLTSKSADLELTRLAMDLKAEIDALREQVQNVE